MTEKRQITEKELHEEEKEKEENDENEPNESGLLETALVGAGAAALLDQSDQPAAHSSRTADTPPAKNLQAITVKEQPTTPLLKTVTAKEEKTSSPQPPHALTVSTTTSAQKPKAFSSETTQSAQPFQESTLIIESFNPKASTISSLYNNLQNNAARNPILFYNALKNPSKNIAIIRSQTLQNELSSIADNRTMVIYLPTETLQIVITNLGFTQLPQPEEQWTITMPLGSVTIEFLPEKVSRLSISSQLLTTTTDEASLKQLTVQTTGAPLSEKQLPVIVFGLPVQKTTALTLINKSIVAVKPSQLAELITQLFFELLEKSKKKEENIIQTPKQKPSPVMRKIVGLPTIPEVPEIPEMPKSPFKKPVKKKVHIKMFSKQTVPQDRPGQISFFRQKSPRLPGALGQSLNKPHVIRNQNMGKVGSIIRTIPK